MRYMSHRRIISVAQEDGATTDSTWTVDGERQEETRIEQQYYSHTKHVKLLQWPFDIREDVTSMESRKPVQDDSRR